MNNKEPKWVKLEAEEVGNPLILAQEGIIMLWKKLDLLGLLVSLIFILKVHPSYIPQQKLAKLVGLSYLSFLKKRKELESIGLLEVETSNNNMSVIHLHYDKLWGLIKIIIPSYKIYKTSLEDTNIDRLSNYLENTGKSLSDHLDTFLSDDKKTRKSNNIYNIFNNIISNKNNNKDNDKYPKEDYDLVINAFKKYKGVGLMGPEIAYHRRAIKLMFQASRKPKEIIDFMKWLRDNERNEETSWVRQWTIWTVQKKIAEFLGGKLEVGKEELERI